jgi:multiple sugar transport system permease protein/raffinose/stachyose/melibiose transport system permease protein
MKSSATRPSRSRRRRTFSRGDRVTLGIFVGIPTFFHLVLVWIPAILTIVLSFTYWTGINFGDIKWAGVANYDNIFTKTPRYAQRMA